MYKRILFFGLFLIIISSPALFCLTAQQIIEKAENRESFQSTYSEGRIVSTDRFGSKESSFKSWSEGSESALLEFSDGQRVLKTKNDIYLYYPDAEVVIRLQGSALRQSVLGSDLSYEDASGFGDTLSNYDVELISDRLLNNRDSYLLSLEAKSKNVAYPKQLIWVDKDNFIIMRRELYTKSNRLLKEIEVLEIGSFENELVPKVTSVVDKLKKESSTKMYLDLLHLNVNHDKSLFSLQNLTW
ncbi:MAG: outer membrane lipoprotein-sorting protein [Sphaerochaetaceae bacterium]